MNFFEQQEAAHRSSRWLIVLFALAVIGIVLCVNLGLSLAWALGTHHRINDWAHYPRGFFVLNTFGTLLLILGGTLVETLRLREGGDAVAAMVGGRLVEPATSNLRERRLINIVEEMALAAGIACPRVYLLDREDSINAFAAGYQANQAVVAVTRGCLERLTRDELQGVIGHEFSHILNGDMRLNVRLIGVLFGIQMVAGFGEQLIDWARWADSGRTRSRNEERGPSVQMMMLVGGIVLLVVGYVGVFFGRLIKSALSRQREFLADASAVQFTRNPDGIGGALSKIGGLSRETGCGSRIESAQAEQLSHLFLGAVRAPSLMGWFATHPPIEERLQRIYGRHVPLQEAPCLPDAAYAEAENASAAMSGLAGSAPAVAAMPTGASSSVDALPFSLSAPVVHTDPGDISFGWHQPDSAEETVRAAARIPESAMALVVLMLIDETRPEIAAAQHAQVKEAFADVAAHVSRLATSWQARELRSTVQWLDRAMPALRSLDALRRTRLLKLARTLIAADQHLSEAEWVLYTVLSYRLSSRAGRAVAVRFDQPEAVRTECMTVLDVFSRGDDAAWQRALAALGWPACSRPPGVDMLAVHHVLMRLNHLAPLAKPRLIRALQAALGPAPAPARIDMLRAVGAALDVPLPAL